MHVVMDNLKLGEIKGCDRSKEKGYPVKGAHNEEMALKSGCGVCNSQRHSLASVTQFGIIFILKKCSCRGPLR